MYLKETEYGNVNWIHLAQNRVSVLTYKHHAKKVYMGRGSKSPCILNLDSSWEWEVRFRFGLRRVPSGTCWVENWVRPTTGTHWRNWMAIKTDSHRKGNRAYHQTGNRWKGNLVRPGTVSHWKGNLECSRNGSHWNGNWTSSRTGCH
jgi:hypothetical protein